jgi:hypothetical protein
MKEAKVGGVPGTGRRSVTVKFGLRGGLVAVLGIETGRAIGWGQKVGDSGQTYRKICFVPSRGGRRVATNFVAMMYRWNCTIDPVVDAKVENKYRGGPCAGQCFAVGFGHLDHTLCIPGSYLNC